MIVVRRRYDPGYLAACRAIAERSGANALPAAFHVVGAGRQPIARIEVTEDLLTLRTIAAIVPDLRRPIDAAFCHPADKARQAIALSLHRARAMDALEARSTLCGGGA